MCDRWLNKGNIALSCQSFSWWMWKSMCMHERSFISSVLWRKHYEISRESHVSQPYTIRLEHVFVTPLGGINSCHAWRILWNAAPANLFVSKVLRTTWNKKICYMRETRLADGFLYVRSIKSDSHVDQVLFLGHSCDLLLWVGVCRHPSCWSYNIFFSGTTGPIFTKFGM